MACSDVILRMGSMVNSFCSFNELPKMLASNKKPLIEGVKHASFHTENSTGFCYSCAKKSISYANDMQFCYHRGVFTHQVERFAVWLDFVFLHVFYKAAVCVSVREKAQTNFMPSVQSPYWATFRVTACWSKTLCRILRGVYLPGDKSTSLQLCLWSSTKLGQQHSRVPSKVFHQRWVFWHLFDVLPVFIW